MSAAVTANVGDVCLLSTLGGSLEHVKNQGLTAVSSSVITYSDMVYSVLPSIGALQLQSFVLA